jgi:cation-transporting ATPase E
LEVLFLNSRILKKRNIPERPELPVVFASAETGLSTAQVQERVSAGFRNEAIEPPTKTTRQIILTNVFSFFNIVFFLLAACVIAVGSWNNLTFMPVVLANMLIGIVQELRSKKTLDKLTLLVSPSSVVIRDGGSSTVHTDELVRDDVVVFAAGDQIYADAVVLEGDCQANEGLITGEADEIRKTVGDRLLSGS